MGARWTRRLVFLTVAFLLASGCSSAQKGERVGSEGRTLHFEGGSLDFGPEAFPSETSVEIVQVSPQLPDTLGQLVTVAGSSVDVRVGQQPRTAVRAHFAVAPSPDGEEGVGAILLRSGDANELVPASWDPTSSTLTAEIPHFSFMVPIWLNPVALWKRANEIVSRLTAQVIGLRTPAPDCAGEPIDIGSTTVSFDGDVTENAPPQWACLEQAGSETLRLSLHSNSGVPWLARASDGGVADPQGAVTLSDIALVAFWQRLASNAPHEERILPPRSTVSYQFSLNDLPGLVETKEDVGAFLAGIALFTPLFLVDVFSGGTGSSLPDGIETVLSAASTLECVQAVVDAAGEIDGLPSVGEVTSIVRGVLACAQPIITALGGILAGPLKVVLSALSGGLALGIGGLKAAADTAFGRDRMSFRFVRQPPPLSLVGLEGDDWYRHGTFFTVESDGSFSLTYRTYRDCGQYPSPCDRTEGHEIFSGGFVYGNFSSGSSPEWVGEITSASTPRSWPNGAVTATYDRETDTLQLKPASGDFRDGVLLCGPRSAVNACGA